MNRRVFIKRTLVGTSLAVGAAAGYGRFLERHAVEVVPVDISIGLPKPLNIVLLSDIHFDPFFETDYLESVIAQANDLKPDMVLYAGDFISRSCQRIQDMARILSGVSSTYGNYAILGNHDHSFGAGQLCSAIESAGIRMLRNESVPVPDREPWHLTGLESYWRGRPDPTCLDRAADDARHILLVHEPDSFDKRMDPRIALQLSGHTHGGQVRLPLYGALQLPYLGKKYDAGLFERAGQKLYVNRGIGTVKHHYRLNCPPEITWMNLT
jgi:predicted MPP superfamily phosphohydrolase